MVDSMEVDKTNIGCWVWVKMVGKEGHTTRVVTAYHPVQAGKNIIRSVYTQHRSNYNQQVERECLRKLFRRDIITKMK